MDNQTLMIVLTSVVVLLAAVFVAWYAIRIWRSRKLREKFGPEYDYTLEKAGSRQTAEQTLLEREKRVNELAIQTLDSDMLDQYQTEWSEIQAEFVDQPSDAVKKPTG